MVMLYHYTDKKGRDAIYQTNRILANEGAAGKAVYFTELPPETTPKNKLAYNNYVTEGKSAVGRTRYWFSFDSKNYPKIKKMTGTGWEKRNVWVHPGDVKLTDHNWSEYLDYELGDLLRCLLEEIMDL